LPDRCDRLGGTRQALGLVGQRTQHDERGIGLAAERAQHVEAHHIP